jgi:putative hydrolase of the HAD superfamily
MKLDHPQAIRTLFFDAGFTLLYPHPSIPEVCQNVCRELGLHIPLALVQQNMEAVESRYFHQQLALRSPWGDEQALTQFWISYYSSLLGPVLAEQDQHRLQQFALAISEEFARHTSWRVYPEVCETLERLCSLGYRLGVISDWGSALGPILRQLNLTQYFDCLLISTVTRYAKPSPQLYELALQRANAIPDYTIHVGDSYIYDVLGARATGITPVLLDRTGKLDPQQIDCFVINSLDELLKLLEVAV